MTVAALTVYAKSTIKGSTDPSGATWWCWAVSGGMIAFSLKASGGSDALWVAFDYLVGPLVIAVIVTAKHGVGNWSWLEKLCVAGSLVGAFIWWRFDSPEVCFVATLFVDCLGAIPTVHKAVTKPNQESWIPWAVFTVGSGFNVGDKLQIRDHVVRNLIDNAIEYTTEGIIKVSIKSSKDKVTLSVKDSGVGICPADMKHLFTQGGRGKNARKIKTHSTGYGLYIAKQIVDAHEGRIWAESEGEGKGSTFYVEFTASSNAKY